MASNGLMRSADVMGSVDPVYPMRSEDPNALR